MQELGVASGDESLSSSDKKLIIELISGSDKSLAAKINNRQSLLCAAVLTSQILKTDPN
jgi:hypothetical protein